MGTKNNYNYLELPLEDPDFFPLPKVEKEVEKRPYDDKVSHEVDLAIHSFEINI